MNSLALRLAPQSGDIPAGEPEWLREVRANTLAQLEADDLPGASDEDWKYTSPRLLRKREFTPGGTAPVDREQAQAALEPLPGGCRAVFVDGRLDPGLSMLEGLSEGLVAGSLQDHLSADGVREALTRGYAHRSDGFARLATARFSDGLYVSVREGLAVEEPLHVVHLTTADNASHLRHVFAIGARASLRLVEHYLSVGESGGLANCLVDCVLNRGARLDWAAVQEQSTNAFLITRREIRQAGESRLHYLGVDTGGKLVRHDINASLTEPGAETDLSGVSLIKGRQHVDNHTRVDHVAPDCTSRERFKAVAADRARGVFNGKLVVHPGADGTDSAQFTGNLLLSPHAEIDTKPELEIYADDVAASHGATVGQLDESAIFYLRSRGIPAETARRLLIMGFCQEAVERFPLAGLRDYLAGRLLAAMPDLEAR